MNRAGVFVLLGAALMAPAVRAAEPKLISVRKIWDQGNHNAFTDLVRFKDKWYCTFREADGHVGGDGQLRVLESADGDVWTSAALLSEEGIDLRDPKLSITPDGRLMIVAGGSVYGGTTKLKSRQPRVAFSSDGHEWTAPAKVLTEGEWLWRVTWHDGRAYGVSYNASPNIDRVSGRSWALTLVASSNGLDWETVTPLAVTNRPNEATLRFTADGEMISLVRREGDSADGNAFAWIGSSRAPYTDWTWKESKLRLGGPNFIMLPNGAWWAGGRNYEGGPKTVLARMTRDTIEPVLTLPSGGDNSYPGLVWHDDRLWMSYYSSHEGKTSIYLAQIEL